MVPEAAHSMLMRIIKFYFISREECFESWSIVIHTVTALESNFNGMSRVDGFVPLILIYNLGDWNLRFFNT